jgi:hypothetical protein
MILIGIIEEARTECVEMNHERADFAMVGSKYRMVVQ